MLDEKGDILTGRLTANGLAAGRGVGEGAEGMIFEGGGEALRRLEAFAEMQHEVLGLILARTPLEETLMWIVRRMEEGSEDGMLCSIFLMEEHGREMKMGAAPGLPLDYNAAVDRLAVGEGIGSCGTAAARGEMVVVEDTWVHPDWEVVRGIVKKYPQLRACWSMPVKSSCGKVLGTMGMYHAELRGPRPDEVRWAQGAARLIGLAIERTEEAMRLQATGAWLTTMLESLDDAFFTLDREWRFVTLNRQTGLLLQRDPGSLVGRVIWEEFQAAAGTAFEASCRRAMKEGRMRVIEEFQAGSNRWLEVRIHPSTQGVAVYFRDVTAARRAAQALRESELRFKLVAKATADTLWDVNVADGTIWWSEGLERMFGHKPEEVGSGLDWWLAHVHPEDRAGVQAGLEKIWQGEGREEIWTADYRFQRRDGLWAFVMDRGYLIRDEAGRAVRLVGGMTDVTERRRIEREGRETAAMQVRMAAVQREISGADLTLQAVLERVADRARRLVAADGAAVGLIEGQEVVVCAASGLAGLRTEGREGLKGGLAGLCVKEGKVLSVFDTQSDARVKGLDYARTGVRSLVAAPLRSGMMDVGVLQLFSLEPGAFSARDVGALEILAESVGAVIQNHLTASRLKSSEARYRLLFDHNRHPMWVMEVESGQFLEVNEAALRQYGFTREAFLKMGMEDLEVAGEGGAGRKWFRNGAGEVREVEVAFDDLEWNGRAARLVQAQDVTDRRPAPGAPEGQAGLLPERSGEAMVMMDPEQRVRFWNEGAERLFGWTAEEAEGCDVQSLLKPVEPAAEEAALKAVLERGEWRGVLERTARDGSRVLMECRWRLLRGADGTPQSILTVNSAMTERERVDPRFLRAQRLESLGGLAGGMAHHLNDILAPIMMSVDLLKRSMGGELQQEMLDEIAAGAQRGASMVERVLAFAGGMGSQRAPVSAGQILTEIGTITRELFPRNIRVQLAVPEDLGMVEGDRIQLQQVLLNLCVYARDAMPAGGQILLSGSNLTLDAHYAGMNAEARAGRYVMMAVEENAGALTPEVVEEMQGTAQTAGSTSQGSGSGWGMGAVMAIVRSHHGFVRVQHEPGQGSRFQLYLPAAQEGVENGQTLISVGPAAAAPASAPASASARAGAVAEGEMPPGHGELILVIDDEPAIARITRQTLEQFGYTVVVAADGAEGVTLYAEHAGKIAAVITDMNMPVMDGATTIHVLTKMNPDVRVIAASGVLARQTEFLATGGVVKEFLMKPYTAPTLLQALRRVLDLPGVSSRP